MTGTPQGASPYVLTLTPRTLPEKLRYLANYLSEGGHWSAAALTLRTIADEVAEDGWDAAPGDGRATEANQARRDERKRCAQLAEDLYATYPEWYDRKDGVKALRDSSFAAVLREDPTDAA